MEDTSEDDHKPVMLFGRDISKIPCFRNSFLYGMGGGIGMGLLTFMFTSRPRMATHYGMASFSLITLGYWVQCRYHFSESKFQLAQLKAGMQQQVMFEGTDLEKEVLSGNTKDA